jgi:hypothetical protein
MKLLFYTMPFSGLPHFCSAGRKRSTAIGFDVPQTIDISALFQSGTAIDQIDAVVNSVSNAMKSEVWDE